MFNRVAAICLIVVLISSYFSRYMTVTAFDVNQEYIARTLCVNKDKPQLHCNGRCYLMKKMKAAEEKEQKQDRETQRHGFQEVLPKQTPVPEILAQVIFQPDYPSLPVAHPICGTHSIFQPPRFS